MELLNIECLGKRLRLEGSIAGWQQTSIGTINWYHKSLQALVTKPFIFIHLN